MKTELNKMEQDFKRKLDKREIQPTDMAWDRLDAMLTVAEKKQKPKRTWMYVAASFLGFLLVGTFLFRLQDTDSVIKNDTPVVTTESKVTEPDPTENKIQEKMLPVTEEKTVVSTNKPATVKAPKNSQRDAGHTVIEQEPLVLTDKETSVAYTEPVPEQDAVKANKRIVTISSEDLLALVEADAKPVRQNKKHNLVDVDANSLLSSVEVELNESFREKAIDGAIKGFNVMRSSLANRNYK